MYTVITMWAVGKNTYGNNPEIFNVYMLIGSLFISVCTLYVPLGASSRHYLYMYVHLFS